jgi:hypothetical protein
MNGSPLDSANFPNALNDIRVESTKNIEQIRRIGDLPLDKPCKFPIDSNVRPVF